MADSWTLAVARDDLSRTVIAEHPVPGAGPGEVLLRVDRVATTANNVTYAVLGDMLGYWNFFPAAARGLDPGLALVPVWGFAEVVSSDLDDVPPGLRVYGYLPPAAHLVVRPGRTSPRGFTDAAPHRAELPPVYNDYVSGGGGFDDLAALFRPLYVTSYLLADRLVSDGFHGAEVVVLSSATSRTAYATAFELSGAGAEVVGLTSPANAGFARDLGCYDRVLTYDGIGDLPARPTVYVDFSGRAATRVAVRERLGDRLVKDVAVGFSHQVPDPDAGELFFAPDHMARRAADWGRAEMHGRVAAAWERFAERLDGRVGITVGHGPEGLRDAWLDVLNGTADPRTGHITQL